MIEKAHEIGKKLRKHVILTTKGVLALTICLKKNIQIKIHLVALPQRYNGLRRVGTEMIYLCFHAEIRNELLSFSS